MLTYVICFSTKLLPVYHAFVEYCVSRDLFLNRPPSLMEYWLYRLYPRETDHNFRAEHGMAWRTWTQGNPRTGAPAFELELGPKPLGLSNPPWYPRHARTKRASLSPFGGSSSASSYSSSSSSSSSMPSASSSRTGRSAARTPEAPGICHAFPAFR